MMNEIRNNKESIKNRMIRDILFSWDMDKSKGFDPFVGLIIDALSSEIYTLTNNVTNIEVRLLNKLAEVLTPATKTTAQPAHAILITQPLEARYLFTKEDTVYYDNPSFNKANGVNNITFSPVCDVPLCKGEVAYLICNGVFYSINEKAEKRVLDRYARTDTANSVWIGLALEKTINSTKELSFYIDFPHTRNRHEYANLLQFTDWYINNHPIKTRQGAGRVHPKSGNNLTETLNEYSTIKLIENEIYKLYRNRFITIKEDFIFTPIIYPAELEYIISLSPIMQEELTRPLLWVQVVFPPTFLTFVLDDMTVCINAVPIAQKVLKSKSRTLNEFVNIICLNMNENEHFLSVQSVTDSQNKQYMEFISDNSSGNATGTYAIRHGGCERFDTRDAKDYLNNLKDLLVEERAMFASESKSKLADTAEQLLTLFKRMDEATDVMEENREIPHYLIMNIKDMKESIKAEYWITNGIAGNGITAGASLIPDPQTPLDIKYTFLLTESAGGKEPPTEEEKIGLYKRVLLSGERIVTNEDIKCFCQSEYPGVFETIEIRRGTAISKRPQNGLIRTTDVHLHIAESFVGQIKEDILLWTIEEKLKGKSPESYNYRFFIEHKK